MPRRGSRLEKGGPDAPSPRPPLEELSGLRHNPGRLRALSYVPEGLSGPAPLVVVLHGCGQSAEGYDLGSGWSRLADRHGFALLFPEQSPANNPGRCFNWFTVGDTQRGMGEAASIREAIGTMARSHEIDRGRIFVTGLSAGGAMASVMLATYPEVFAAGAILAGIPYGCASGIAEAFDCMGGRSRLSDEALAANVRRASPHRGPWPRVSIWQGTADATVVPSNADALARQWCRLHGFANGPDIVDEVDSYPHRVWQNVHGEPAVEQFIVTGMGHGTPLMPGEEEGQSGQAMPHMLDVGLSSTDRIAQFFGIAAGAPLHAGRAAPAARGCRRKRRSGPEAAPAGPPQIVAGTALRASGLLE
ncbi:MAG: hypothetical protein QOH81_2942 [Sphingomonadales bacterium]|jgi:poly(hydroxyalkanoate) depolymerase family esterase|nr:hypothetical protein [Sphingomonadales bacterium]